MHNPKICLEPPKICLEGKSENMLRTSENMLEIRKYTYKEEKSFHCDLITITWFTRTETVLNVEHLKVIGRLKVFDMEVHTKRCNTRLSGNRLFYGVNLYFGFLLPMTRGHSVIPIRPRDYLSIPWMVQLIPGG